MAGSSNLTPDLLPCLQPEYCVSSRTFGVDRRRFRQPEPRTGFERLTPSPGSPGEGGGGGGEGALSRQWQKTLTLPLFSRSTGRGNHDGHLQWLWVTTSRVPREDESRLSNKRQRRTYRRRGYVLLIVLMVLAIAGAVLAGVCRMSLERALFAERAQADLQRRWGVLTCRTVLLPKAEAALSSSGSHASEVRGNLHLGGQAFSLVFGDEQAKANVNMLYRDGGLAGSESRVREIAALSNVRTSCGRCRTARTPRPRPGSRRAVLPRVTLPTQRNYLACSRHSARYS